MSRCITTTTTTTTTVRYSKVGNYYYYSIAVTSLSLNLFTYVISIASAGLGTPASLQHAGKTVSRGLQRAPYCFIAFYRWNSTCEDVLFHIIRLLALDV